jgi:hypothetical protein
MAKIGLQEMARKLYRHYQAKLIAEASHHCQVSYSFEPLEAQSNKIQTLFQKAAASCIGVGARPREWIEAQFTKFEDYARYLNKRIIPQPAQLYGLHAQARFVQWRVERTAADDREKRRSVTIQSALAIDERKLKSLCRTLRLPETDVLVNRPEEFSVKFLKRKGVYELVSDKRAAAVDGGYS